jgi:cell division inhibitor SepF
MAGSLRKMAVYLGLVEDESYDDFDDYEETRRDVRGRDRRSSRVDVEEERYESRSVRPIPEPRAVRTFRSDATPDRRPSVAPMADRRPVDISRIETVHPRSYNDARRIGEDFRDGVPVIMNLSELDDSDAKRIIDFAAGLVFGLRGSIERITNKVFLLSPVNVDVGDMARKQVAEDGFFNQS